MSATTHEPNLTTRTHLEQALKMSSEPEVRYHLRQALQLFIE